MSKCKITVVRKTLNSDLAKEYCQNDVTPCNRYQEGQEFVTSFEKPAGFCDWAWNDIHHYVVAMLTGGSFGELFKGWMKDDRTMIACCTDGIRPVVFKIERIED